MESGENSNQPNKTTIPAAENESAGESLSKAHVPPGEKVPTSKLVLGWEVTLGGDPRYWLKTGAKPGDHDESDLVTVPAIALGAHTAIVAQSGSGKSFFLGRLIEEILIRTKSSCIVLDPNGDFTRMHEVKSDQWKSRDYDPAKRMGFLTEERSRDQFEQPWNSISKFVFTRDSSYLDDKQDWCKELLVWWPALSVDLLIEDIDALHRPQVYLLHEFVKALGRLAALKSALSGDLVDPIADAKKLYDRHFGVDHPTPEAARYIRTDIAGYLSALPRDGEWLRKLAEYDPMEALVHKAFPSESENRISSQRKDAERASTALEYVKPEVADLYFGRASEFKQRGILADRPDRGIVNRGKLLVVDLDSLEDNTCRLLAINATLSGEWERARRDRIEYTKKAEEQDVRAPTFIVVDEAHHFISADPGDRAEKALLQQFRRIAAEGRKYGLFLILISQRPDKLDPLVLSECENKAVMRMGSTTVLSITRERLGLEDVPSRILEKCLEFEIGRVLLAGGWAANSAKFLYSAARRTAEGGRGLRADYWASPGLPTTAIDRVHSQLKEKLRPRD